jgi:serine/threonine-protein kinase
MLSPVRVGDVIAAKYRVERVLGRGGMGVVVAARHLELRERVAIKVLFPRPGVNRDLMARSVHEGRAAMRIRSEHVVRVYDIGMLETGEPFLVMEYLSGTDLGALVAREGTLRVEDAIEYLLQAIEALAEAHARGIVHRDLKPGNLFLARRADGSPLVKVLDFGIARSEALEASAPEPAGVAGTPVYMAPEQMRTGGVIDARTDVWGLGVTLYALLTGEAPFRAGSLLEIHERILGGAPPLRAARPDAPEALEAILLRCLAKDPAERFASVADLGAALAALAPDHARVSAQRASRILAAAPLAPESVDHEDAGAGEPGKEAPSTSVMPATQTPAPASWKDAALDSATAMEAPSGSLRLEVASPPRAPAWRLPLALVGAGLGGGLLAVAALQDRRPTVIEPPARAPENAVRTAEPAPPKISPASSGETTSQPLPLSSTAVGDGGLARQGGLRPQAPVDALKPRTLRPGPPSQDGARAPSPARPTTAPPHDPLADPD